LRVGAAENGGIKLVFVKGPRARDGAETRATYVP